MKKTLAKIVPEVPAVSADSSELDRLIGERSAYSRVSDSCSAADAECLRKMRDEKLYLAKGVKWNQFCPKYLRISKTEANRIIQRFEEFGQSYFDLSRIVRISPESYRAIASAVKDKTIEWNGERIPLVQENSKRVNAAVQALRAAVAPPKSIAAPPASQDPVYDRLNLLETQIGEIASELQKICRQSKNGRDRQRIQSLAHHIRFRMFDLEKEAA